MKNEEKFEIEVFYNALLIYREIVYDFIDVHGISYEHFFDILEILKVCDNFIFDLQKEYSFLKR